MATNFEKLVKTLEGVGAKVTQMKKNFGDIYSIENDGKQIIVKMFKENETANTLYTKVYIDGHVVYNSSITPANGGKNIEIASKDLLDFINKIFKVEVKNVDNTEEPKPEQAKEEVEPSNTKQTEVKVKDVLMAIKAIDGIVEGLEVVKDVLVKLTK